MKCHFCTPLPCFWSPDLLWPSSLRMTPGQYHAKSHFRYSLVHELGLWKWLLFFWLCMTRNKFAQGRMCIYVHSVYQPTDLPSCFLNSTQKQYSSLKHNCLPKVSIKTCKRFRMSEHLFTDQARQDDVNSEQRCLFSPPFFCGSEQAVILH